MRHDFPVEPADNPKILIPTPHQVNIYYGAAKWGSPEWVGRIYPKGTKGRNFLSQYVKHFNAVHVNATHYKTYEPEEIAKWTKRAEGKEVLFCPKFPQSISHHSTFVNIDEKTNAFLNSIYAFGAHLGPVLLQVGEGFSPKRKGDLFTYLLSLPTDVQFFLEVRNREWFEENEYAALLQFLRTNNIGLVISDTDVPERPLLFDLTMSTCYIKYYVSGDLSRLDRWYEKIKEWGNKGLFNAYFFVFSDNNQTQLLDELLYFKKLVENG